MSSAIRAQFQHPPREFMASLEITRRDICARVTQKFGQGVASQMWE